MKEILPLYTLGLVKAGLVTFEAQLWGMEHGDEKFFYDAPVL